MTLLSQSIFLASLTSCLLQHVVVVHILFGLGDFQMIALPLLWKFNQCVNGITDPAYLKLASILSIIVLVNLCNHLIFP